VITTFLDHTYTLLWGVPLPLLIMGVGIYLTIVLRGVQFRYLFYALKLVVIEEHKKGDKGDISHFQALMTALAATIGIGNIAGIATAIVVGGMGAIFWMWVTAIIGMATRFAESILAVKYRTTDKKGEMCGGPMYFIQYGLGWKWLAASFAFCGAVAAFGGGNMLQANSVADVMKETFSVDPLVTGIIVAVLAGMTILGGIKSIGKVASYLVPMMVAFYILGAGTVLVLNFTKIPEVFAMIVKSAFTGQAAFGGFLGSTMILAIQVGVSRGLMTSEAGLGTASIAAAAAQTDVPGRQALVSMTGCFLATIVMCTLTGLVLGVTGVLGTYSAEGKLLTGAAMTMTAFQSAIPYGGFIVTICLILFAFTTLVGYAYYGEKCIEFLFGERLVPFYRIVFILIIIPGAILDLEIVWKISDVFNGMMAIPNLIGIMALSKIVIEEKRSFAKMLKQEALLEE